MHSFPKSRRLLKKKNIHVVLKKGARKRAPFFSFFSLRNNEQHSRLGIIVSKRNVKLAVRRNAIKRLIREFFRTRTDEALKHDVVIVAHAVGNVTRRDLYQCLENLFT